jgi:iron complex outermembrane recepter protein
MYKATYSNNSNRITRSASVIVSLILMSVSAFSQSQTLTGKIADRITGEPLQGADIIIKTTAQKASSDKTGNFSIELTDTSLTIEIRYLGYKTLYIRPSVFNGTFADIHLEQDIIAFNEGAVVVGSNHSPVTVISSAVPVDRFPGTVLESTGQTDLSQQLNSLAPSFYSSRLTYSDATDHMDPATLRGMNPDQTLILVNGKRHHLSAVVNTLGVVSRGSVINDLNTIPSSAVSRVEILRDGASAQYGSDAIAGVINIILKENSGKLNFKSQVGQTYEGDGLQTNLGANYGINIGKKAFINFSSELRKRESTNRAGIYQGLIYRTSDQDGLSLSENLALDNQEIADRGLSREDFKMQLGNSAMTDGSFYLNSGISLNKSFDFYLFGGANLRNSLSAGDFRLPNDAARRNLARYPDGFLPEIEAGLNDEFVSGGITGNIKKWNSDLSYTFGRNAISFSVNNSANASMGASSPVSFNSGGIAYQQGVVNLDINRDFSKELGFSLFRLSFGSELRNENYRIKAGEEASWINQDQASYPGAQGFPGFQPSDEVNASRNNLALYSDLSIEPVKKWLIEGALRFENYSDFGSKLSGKLASRYSLTDWLNIRGSYNTGFRAPALHQLNYNYTGSYYFGGYLYDVLTSRNTNPVTSAFGIPALKAEDSRSYSIGITANPLENFRISVDFYQVDVQNRIVLSGFFYKGFGNQVVDSLMADFTTTGGVQFFTNAIDTKTRGAEAVLTYDYPYSGGLLGASFGLNYSKNNVTGALHTSDAIIKNGLTDQLFDRQSRALIELAQPSLKYTLTLNWIFSRFNLVLRNSYFGEVSYLSQYDPTQDQVYSAKWITDLKIAYRISGKISVSAGANNLFNVYPDKNNAGLMNQGRFIYNTAVTQFGFNGGFYYAGLELNL